MNDATGVLSLGPALWLALCRGNAEWRLGSLLNAVCLEGLGPFGAASNRFQD